MFPTVCTALERVCTARWKKLLPMTTAVRVLADEYPIACTCTDALESQSTRWPGP
jgi:hypothetical protein